MFQSRLNIVDYDLRRFLTLSSALVLNMLSAFPDIFGINSYYMSLCKHIQTFCITVGGFQLRGIWDMARTRAPAIPRTGKLPALFLRSNYAAMQVSINPASASIEGTIV